MLWTGWPSNRGAILSRTKRFFFFPKFSYRLWDSHSLLFSGYCGQSGWGLKLTTDLHVVSKLKISGIIPPHSYAFMANAGTVLHFLIYVQQDATLHSLFYLEIALHVSGVTSTHHQERIQLYLQHLVFVTPLLLPATSGTHTHTHTHTHTESGTLQRRIPQRTVFINKIRMLQRMRRNPIGGHSTRVRMTCRAFPLWSERQSSSWLSFVRFSY